MRHAMAGRLYERLTPRERLTMLTQALARHDTAEARRLHETTPTKAYRCTEEEFDLPFRVLWQLAYMLSIQLSLYVGKLEVLAKTQKMAPVMMGMAAKEAVQDILTLLGEPIPTHDESDNGGADVDDRQAQSDADDPLNPHQAPLQGSLEKVEKVLADWRKRLAGEASGMLASFDQFTREVVDVDGMTVLRAWMWPVADEIEALGVAEHDPDPTMKREWGEVWRSVWNRKLRLKPRDIGDGNKPPLEAKGAQIEAPPNPAGEATK